MFYKLKWVGSAEANTRVSKMSLWVKTSNVVINKHFLEMHGDSTSTAHKKSKLEGQQDSG